MPGSNNDNTNVPTFDKDNIVDPTHNNDNTAVPTFDNDNIVDPIYENDNNFKTPCDKDVIADIKFDNEMMNDDEPLIMIIMLNLSMKMIILFTLLYLC